VKLEAVPIVRRFTLSKKPIVGEVVAARGMVIVADSAGVLAAAMERGDAGWRLPTKSTTNENSFPVEVGNRGFFADRKGLLVCVDLEAGKVLWQALLSARSSIGVFQDLACGEQGVFAWVKGTLYGLSPETGEPLFAPITGVAAPPLYREGRIYYGTEQGSLRIADAATGRVLGTLDVKARISTRPTWSAGMLFVGTWAGEIVQINTAAVR
jgi:outer membrane protein assembly factor BamB